MLFASLDTCNRLETHVVQNCLVKGNTPSLVPNMLTIASVDNIDNLQFHAVVSSLDATRSWHGTSVQFMQPMPETGILDHMKLLVHFNVQNEENGQSMSSAHHIQ